MSTLTTIHACHCSDPLQHFFNLINLFTYCWLCWGFVAALGLSLAVASRGYSSLRCVGFSLRWPLLLQSTGSRRVGFRSCGPQTKVPCSTWDLPRPGMEPMSPASAGGFLTTGPPGKSPLHQFCSRTAPPGFQWAPLGETRRWRLAEWNTDSTPAAGLGATLILISSFLHDPFWIILNYHLGRSQWPTPLDPITEGGELLVAVSFPGQDDRTCPFTITVEGGSGRRHPRGSLDATHIPPCLLWCLLISRSSASTQWELLSLYHILWSRKNLKCSASHYSM